MTYRTHYDVKFEERHFHGRHCSRDLRQRSTVRRRHPVNSRARASRINVRARHKAAERDVQLLPRRASVSRIPARETAMPPHYYGQTKRSSPSSLPAKRNSFRCLASATCIADTYNAIARAPLPSWFIAEVPIRISQYTPRQ